MQEGQIHRSVEQNRGSEIDIRKYIPMIFNKDAKVVKWKKTFQQMVLQQLDIDRGNKNKRGRRA